MDSWEGNDEKWLMVNIPLIHWICALIFVTILHRKEFQLRSANKNVETGGFCLQQHTLKVQVDLLKCLQE